MNYWKHYFIKGCIGILILLFTFIIALLLNMLPLPYQFKWLMPNWLVLVLIYWIIFVPELIGVMFTFVLGMVVDLLVGNLLGLTSLCLVPVAFFADRLGRRFRTFNMWQQFLVVIVLVSINHLIRLWFQLYINYPTSNINYWLTIPISIIAWPLVCGCLHLFRKVIKFC